VPRDPDEYDFFVSYARSDNRDSWIDRFIDELLAEHRQFSGGRELTYFFDRNDIGSLDDWQHSLHDGLARSRLFLAFLSPAYFASEWCRREWKAWIDTEIAKHILSGGAAPLYFVEVPGFVGRLPGFQEQAMLDEHEVARKVAELCGVPEPRAEFVDAAAPVIHQIRDRRQIVSEFVQPFFRQGIDALREADLRRVLAGLARELDERAEQVRLAAKSETTVPPYNKRFCGRLDELLELRERLQDDQAGVICGVHGLGGIGKSELAFTYAHAFASIYPGGRFLVPCEGKASLRDAALVLGDLFRDQISDEERMTPESYFGAISACLRERLERQGRVLLVLDNVTDLAIVSTEQTDLLTSLGPQLHLLATTRKLPPAGGGWLTLGELPASDALDMLEKHRPFADDGERAAAERIVKQLGGFALAVELVAAGLRAHPSATYGSIAEGIGLEDLDTLAEDEDVELRRHNHERRLRAVLEPALAALETAELRALEYAALLPPDQVPLPWLRELVTGDLPDIAGGGRWGDPWDELCERLVRLALFTRVEEEITSRRLVRVHRLVQDLVRDDLSEEELSERQQAVEQLVAIRADALKKTTDWQNACWEVEPLDALANLWTDMGNGKAARLLNEAGMRWRDLAEWSRAEPLLRRALVINEQTFGFEHPEVAAALNNLAQLLQDTNRLSEAEPLMRRALSIAEQCFGTEHPDVATGLNNLAVLLQDTSRLSEAEPLMRRALAIDEQSFGPEHPKVATTLNNLARFLRDTNRLPEAEPLVRRALSIDEQSLGSEHPKVATSLSNLAQLLKATNRLSEAEPLMRRALTIDEQCFGPEHPNVATRLNNLAQLLQDTNRLSEAEPLMRRALSIDEESFGPEHPGVAIDLNNLAALLQETNRLSEAEPLMRRMVEIFLKFTADTGHSHPRLQAGLGHFTELLKALGRSEAEVQQEVNDLYAKYGVSPD